MKHASHRGLRFAATRALVALAAMVFTFAAAAQPTKPLTNEQLLSYLDQLTQWQRDVAALEPTSTNSREVVFRDSLRDNATKVLRSGFGFLRSIAEDNAPEVEANSTRDKLNQRMEEITSHVAQLKAQRAKATGAARQATDDALRLEAARQELIQTILANLNAASSKSPDKLRYTIESLSRSIPELSGHTTVAPVKTNGEKRSTKRSGASLLSLSADVFEITRKRRELEVMLIETSELKDESMAMMQTLRAGLGEPAEPNQDQPAAAALSVEERIAAYKQLGAYIVPLAETMRAIDASRQTAKEWLGVLEQQRALLGQRLAVNIGVLLVTLAIPLVLGELARRACKRINDPRRRRQLSTARRVAVTIALVVILLLNFISDFSSFATFAGFLTAGLAVALQSVLLSLVAHFLFYGRYGVRNGDRVHVAGVTGDIVQIGMVRFYVRELHEGEQGLVPTGKIVAFPNSILFQNIAFYKYA